MDSRDSVDSGEQLGVGGGERVPLGAGRLMLDRGDLGEDNRQAHATSDST
jgi:hypothetical protein